MSEYVVRHQLSRKLPLILGFHSLTDLIGQIPIDQQGFDVDVAEHGMRMDCQQTDCTRQIWVVCAETGSVPELDDIEALLPLKDKRAASEAA